MQSVGWQVGVSQFLSFEVVESMVWGWQDNEWFKLSENTFDPDFLCLPPSAVVVLPAVVWLSFLPWDFGLWDPQCQRHCH